MKVEFGLLKTVFTDEEKINCHASDCARLIKTDFECFVDTSDSKIYCKSCGNCLKYQRKKEEQRKEMGITNTPLIKGLDY